MHCWLLYNTTLHTFYEATSRSTNVPYKETEADTIPHYVFHKACATRLTAFAYFS